MRKRWRLSLHKSPTSSGGGNGDGGGRVEEQDLNDAFFVLGEKGLVRSRRGVVLEYACGVAAQNQDTVQSKPSMPFILVKLS